MTDHPPQGPGLMFERFLDPERISPPDWAAVSRTDGNPAVLTTEEALELVATTIGARTGITRLRFESSGSMTGRTSLRVTALARGKGKRAKGTKEVQFTGGAKPGPWMDIFAALAPDLPLAHGCAENTGFDVDASGTLTNIHRPR